MHIISWLAGKVRVSSHSDRMFTYFRFAGVQRCGRDVPGRRDSGNEPDQSAETAAGLQLAGVRGQMLQDGAGEGPQAFRLLFTYPSLSPVLLHRTINDSVVLVCNQNPLHTGTLSRACSSSPQLTPARAGRESSEYSYRPASML